MTRFSLLAAPALALALTACAGYENTTREAARTGAMGAAAGAAIGAVSGDVDPAEGAAVGAAVGAAAGAYQGCRMDNRCPWSRNNDQHGELQYDRGADRYYYYNARTGCTYWRNGEYRGGC